MKVVTGYLRYSFGATFVIAESLLRCMHIRRTAVSRSPLAGVSCVRARFLDQLS
jgi:hypothetical protein